MITDSKLFKGLMSENENLKELLEENKFDDLTAEQQLTVEAWEEDKVDHDYKADKEDKK
jgi:hypothetical protein